MPLTEAAVDDEPAAVIDVTSRCGSTHRRECPKQFIVSPSGWRLCPHSPIGCTRWQDSTRQADWLSFAWHADIRVEFVSFEASALTGR